MLQSSKTLMKLMRVHAPWLLVCCSLYTLAGCSSEDQSAAPSQAEAPVYEGALVTYRAGYDDGTSEEQLFLEQTKDGVETELQLFFDAEPAIPSGTELKVWGVKDDRGLAVERFEVVAMSENQRRSQAERSQLAQGGFAQTDSALVGADAFPTRRFAFVLVDIGGGVDRTKEQVEATMFGDGDDVRSVRTYFQEVSYERQDIDGDVLGPFRFEMDGCNTRELANQLRSRIPGNYDHYLWYMGSRNRSCGWSGLAQSGIPDNPRRDTWYNGSFGCVVLIQEPGHNLGGQHSSRIDCGDEPFVDVPEGNCQHLEYGDPYDPLGGGCFHMNGYQKAYQQWLTECNGVRVNSSGEFRLFPIENPCNGIQTLQIPMARSRPFSRSGGGGRGTTESLEYFYLELRTNVGFDARMPDAPTVLVHTAENWRDPNLVGRHTWLMDMDPSTRQPDGLKLGESYTDPAGGVRFEITELSEEYATVRVDIEGGSGDPTCLDGFPMLPPGPATCDLQPVRATGANASPGAAGDGFRVSGFTLIDAARDQPLMEVRDGDILNLDVLPRNLNLRSDTVPPVVGSVRHEVDGTIGLGENIPPYSIGGDDGQGDFRPWDLEEGQHVVTATAYEERDGRGVRGGALTVRFTLARLGDEPVEPDPTVSIPEEAGVAEPEEPVEPVESDEPIDAGIPDPDGGAAAPSPTVAPEAEPPPAEPAVVEPEQPAVPVVDSLPPSVQMAPPPPPSLQPQGGSNEPGDIAPTLGAEDSGGCSVRGRTAPTSFGWMSFALLGLAVVARRRRTWRPSRLLATAGLFTLGCGGDAETGAGSPAAELAGSAPGASPVQAGASQPGGPVQTVVPGSAVAAGEAAAPGSQGVGVPAVNEAPPPPALEVVSTEPEDGSSELGLSTPLVVQFSVPVDPASVDDNSFVVRGPFAAIEGSLEVEGAQVRFTPTTQLPRGTQLELNVSSELMSEAAAALEVPLAATFTTRDGEFADPEQLDTGATVRLQVVSNTEGDIALSWSNVDVVSSIEAMVFDAQAGEWTQPELIESNEQRAFSQPAVALGGNGDVIVSWAGGGWNRYSDGWQGAQIDPGTGARLLASTGEATLAAWQQQARINFSTLVAGGSEWSEPQNLANDQFAVALHPWAEGALLFGLNREQSQLEAHAFLDGSFMESQVVVSGEFSDLNFATAGSMAIVSWQSEGMLTTRFLRDGIWQEPDTHGEGTEARVAVASSGAASVVFQRGLSVVARVLGPEGWEEEQVLADSSQFPPVVAVDDSGNANVAWADGGQLHLRRYSSFSGWAENDDVISSSVSGGMWATGGRGGVQGLVWRNGAGTWWSRFE